MKKTKFLAVAIIASLLGIHAVADQYVTLNWGAGQTVTMAVPDDLAIMINSNKAAIENALTVNGIDSTTAETYVQEAKTAYTAFLSSAGIKTTMPYTTVINGLNEFTGALVDSIPNAQIQQNVWANSWIGYILPKPSFGVGINAGVSKLDMGSLKRAGEALGIDMGNVPGTLAFPIATVDARVGGFILPFDVGFTISGFDTSKISPLHNAIKPATYDFFTIGFDVRYAVVKGGLILPKISAGLGYYYTSGHFGADNNGSSAELDFKVQNIVLSAQASKKFAFFVPYAGVRVMFAKSNIDWKATANWANILKASNNIMDAIAYGILPSRFNGGTEKGFTDHVRPVIFGGFAFDLAFIDITLAASYDFISEVPSGALSVRFAMN